MMIKKTKKMFNKITQVIFHLDLLINAFVVVDFFSFILFQHQFISDISDRFDNNIGIESF